MFDHFRNAYWWILHRVHPRHRYHIINTGLSPGYYDEDELILHSCMTILDRYIQSMGGEHEVRAFNKYLLNDPPEFGEEICRKQAAKQQEALQIWMWWTKQRPKEHKHHEDECIRLFGHQTFLVQEEERQAYHRREERLLQKDLEMLHRLIDIHSSLWT